ncbi:retrovirus-related Pol polyprotein from type-1 retrotransposable element R1 [Trichonephila clavipes]|nr:retrovirus-related Pol polyprotein from type-1 retrotransposable element R1 [Trichonephila clavipes]
MVMAYPARELLSYQAEFSPNCQQSSVHSEDGRKYLPIGKTTRKEDLRIVRQAFVAPTVTRSTIQADLGVAIVPQIISRYLAEANLKSKRTFRALPLTPKDTFEKDMGSKIKKNKERKNKDEGIITSLLQSFPGAAGTDEYLKMEATLSAFETFLQTADAKRLKGSSPMLMEFLIPIFHIFSGLVVKKLPSSSVSPSGPPTEERSDAPTLEALDNAYQHIRDLEKQVALSEGKLQESQRSIIAKPSYAQVASSPAAVSSFTIPPPPSEQVLLVRPLEPNAGSSTTRNKITSFLLSKNLPFRITRIKNINNGGIAICLTTDEDVSKLSQELSNNADFASFSISKPVRRKPQFILFGVDSSYNKDSITKALLLKNEIFKDDGFEVNFSIKSKSSNNWVISVIPDLYPVIKDHGYLYLNFERVRIETFISVMQCSTCGTLGHTRNHCSNTQACFSCSSTDDHDRTSCEPRCINCTNHNIRFRSGLGPTFHGPRSAVGNPDLTLASCDLVSFVENWEILSTESLSDHSFISVHLRCDLIFSDFVFKTKYGINKFIYNFRKNYNLLNSFLTNISSIELLDDFASLLINTTNASAFSTLRKRRVLNTPSFKWWNNSLRIQRNQLNAYKRRVVSLTTHGMSVDEIAFMHSRYKALRANYKKSIIDTKNKAWEYFCSTNSNNFGFTFKAAFGKLSSPTNLHQISTGDPASLFHSKVSLLLDSHFPSGSPPILLVFNDCSPPSCLSPSEVEVVFRKLRGGKAPGIDLIDYAIWKALYNSFPQLAFSVL